ncbi:MAG: hypothetical protein Q8Q62_06225 [Mesorhizobium sp.]|nr:hypothetical protein [Mesorhizobium sp.]
MTSSRRFRATDFLILIISVVALVSVGIHQASARVYRPAQADLVETVRFSTDGHPKSKGVNLVMRYPASWKSKESEFPNIVQMFVSENGVGLQMAQIWTKKIPGHENISRAEAEEFLWEDPSFFLPRLSNSISFQKTEVNGEPAALLEFTTVRSVGGRSMMMRNLSLHFFHAGTWINISYSVADAEDSGPDVDVTFQNFRNLFVSMMSTIVLPDKWK